MSDGRRGVNVAGWQVSTQKGTLAETQENHEDTSTALEVTFRKRAVFSIGFDSSTSGDPEIKLCDG